MSIRALPGGRFRVVSKTGRNLGTFASRKQAEKRLRQVEFFKRRDKAANIKTD